MRCHYDFPRALSFPRYPSICTWKSFAREHLCWCSRSMSRSNGGRNIPARHPFGRAGRCCCFPILLHLRWWCFRSLSCRCSVASSLRCRGDRSPTFGANISSRYGQRPSSNIANVMQVYSKASEARDGYPPPTIAFSLQLLLIPPEAPLEPRNRTCASLPQKLPPIYREDIHASVR